MVLLEDVFVPTEFYRRMRCVEPAPGLVSGLLVGGLRHAGLVTPQCDAAALEVVLGKGTPAARFACEVAHHVGEAAVDLDSAPVVKSERVDARNMTVLAMPDTSPMRRVAMRRERLFSTCGSV